MNLYKNQHQNQSLSTDDKGWIEAMIFASPNGITLSRLLLDFPHLSARIIQNLIDALTKDYDCYQGALELVKNRDGGYQFRVRHAVMVKTGPNAFTHDEEFTHTEIEVLAFIAYNQPIEPQDIIDILGTRVKKGIKSLIRNGFITECKDKETKFIIHNEEITQNVTGLITSPYFAEYFNILNDLSTIRGLFESVIS